MVRTGLINFGRCNKDSGECEDEYLIRHMGVLAKAGKPFEWLKPSDIKRFLRLRLLWVWGKICPE